MVHLGHHGEMAVLQPFHHVELPEWLPSVEWPGGQIGHQRGQLPSASRAREAGPSDVVVDVELRVVDHRGVLKPEGDLEHPHPEGGHQVHPFGHHLPDVAELHPAGHAARIEDQRAEDVEMGGRRLQ